MGSGFWHCGSNFSNQQWTPRSTKPPRSNKSRPPSQPNLPGQPKVDPQATKPPRSTKSEPPGQPNLLGQPKVDHQVNQTPQVNQKWAPRSTSGCQNWTGQSTFGEGPFLCMTHCHTRFPSAHRNQIIKIPYIPLTHNML